jgi:hypothetical protein
VRSPSRASAYDTLYSPPPTHTSSSGAKLDAPVLRRGQADHAFAEGNEVELAVFRVADLHGMAPSACVCACCIVSAQGNYSGARATTSAVRGATRELTVKDY